MKLTFQLSEILKDNSKLSGQYLLFQNFILNPLNCKPIDSFEISLRYRDIQSSMLLLRENEEYFSKEMMFIIPAGEFQLVLKAVFENIKLQIAKFEVTDISYFQRQPMQVVQMHLQQDFRVFPAEVFKYLVVNNYYQHQEQQIPQLETLRLNQ